jgi:hypothetical protein
VSARHSFEIVCPNNHNQTVRFSQQEFEQVLKSGTLRFHYCKSALILVPWSVPARRRFHRNLLQGATQFTTIKVLLTFGDVGESRC